MKNILKKLALLAIPVLLWLAFFIAFEPNNYFGAEGLRDVQPAGCAGAGVPAGARYKFDFG